MSIQTTSSHFISFQTLSQCSSLPEVGNSLSHKCVIHTEKNLNLICTYPFCSKKGLLCLLCQHQDHFAHSQYCLPWEIFMENIENLRKNDKVIVFELKEKLKAINNASKKIIKDFMNKTQEVCHALSREIDRNVEREIALMEEILKNDRQMSHDFHKIDHGLEEYRNIIRPHLEKLNVEIRVEKAEKINFICKDTVGFFHELHDLGDKTQKFDNYLKVSFQKLEESLGKMYGMEYFRVGMETDAVFKKKEDNTENHKDVGISHQNNAQTKMTLVFQNHLQTPFKKKEENVEKIEMTTTGSTSNSMNNLLFQNSSQLQKTKSALIFNEK